MISPETYSLLKPFTATVDSGGKATIQIGHNISRILWQVFQIGFGLGQASPSPQVGAHFNGLPLTSTVTMQSVSFTGVPYAMESFMVGPPYPGLRAGDIITCSVIGAVAGDIFTAGAYISEVYLS